MKVGYLVAGAVGLASIIVIGIVGTAGAKDEWFVLSEQTIKATDPSVRITAEEGKWIKEDVKDVKLSVEGADVEIRKSSFTGTIVQTRPNGTSVSSRPEDKRPRSPLPDTRGPSGR